MEINDNLTILLVLKDRESYTHRLMGYLNKISCPFKILIADGGTEDIAVSLEKYNNIKYEYVKYPYDQTIKHFTSKMADVVDKITTPLCMVVDNDDFFIIEGIKHCIEFLRTHPQYSTARGAMGAIQIHDKHLHFERNIYSIYIDPITGESAAERILDQSKHFHGNWHAVIRTNHLQATYKLIDLWCPSNFRFIEQLVGYLYVAWGNGCRTIETPNIPFPEGYYLHETSTQRVELDGNALASHFPPQDEWIHSDYWPEDFAKMTNAIAAAICHIDGSNWDDARRHFKKAYLHKLPDLQELLERRIDESENFNGDYTHAEATLNKIMPPNEIIEQPIFPTAKSEWESLRSHIGEC